MKLTFFIIFLIILSPFFYASAEDVVFSQKLKGRILLQVESRGEAWYVHPVSAERYYMANGDEAYSIMRNFGIGITNSDLSNIQKDKNLAQKHAGKIFLQVEKNGEAFYVDFDGNVNYMKDGCVAYNIMRNFGLGITNNDLEKIKFNSIQSDLEKKSNNQIFCDIESNLIYDSKIDKCIDVDVACEQKFGTNWVYSSGKCVCRAGTFYLNDACYDGDNYCKKSFGINSYYIADENKCYCESGYSLIENVCTKDQEIVYNYSNEINNNFYISNSDDEQDIIGKLFKNSAKIASICDDEIVFLGTISSKYDADSIFNKYGDYGSKYNSGSMWNKYGDYGGKYSSCSPFNKYSTEPPSIYIGKDLVGYISLNRYVADSSVFTINPNNLLFFGYLQYNNDYFLDLMID